MTIKELNIKPKLRKGTGTYKDMYFIDTRPDLVVKVFDRLSNESINDVRREEELSKKYPNLFTKILKINYDRGYMIQEKTDVDTFIKDVENVTKEISKLNSSFSSIDIVGYLYTHIFDKEAINVFRKNLKDKNNIKFFDKLVKYLDTLRVTHVTDDPDSEEPYVNLDTHSGNFGYDKQGNIKMFDI